MIPPVFGWLNVASVNAFVSGRIYGFGRAPQDPPKPYITWFVVSGVPSNYHSQTPAVDKHRIQVDIWSDDQQQTLDIGSVVQAELDKHGHQSNQDGPTVDSDTLTNRISFDYSVWTDR